MELQFYQESLLRFAWRKNKKKDIKPNGIAQTPLDELGEGIVADDELLEEAGGFVIGNWGGKTDSLESGTDDVEGGTWGGDSGTTIGGETGSCGIIIESDSSGLPSKHFWKVNSISLDRYPGLSTRKMKRAVRKLTFPDARRETLPF